MSEPDFSFLGDQSPPGRPRTGVATPRPSVPSNPWPRVIIFGCLGFFVMTAVGSVISAWTMSMVDDRVLSDCVRQYFIVADNGGSEMDLYDRAAFVAEVALQAGDEAAYAKWVKVRDVHGRRAGLEP